VNVKETGCRQRIVTLAGLVSPFPGAAILLHTWPHKTLCVQFHLCFGVWMRHHGWTGTLGAVEELERAAEISQQTYRSRWRPWCRELVVSLATGRWLTQECLKHVVAVQRCGQCVVEWWRSDGLMARESVGDNVVLSRDVSYVSRKLGYKVEVMKLQG
jgi:hypothetical protein